MAQDSTSKSATLIFGAIFLFALLRAALIVNMGAGLLLFLPTVGLPVYYFGKMFFISLSEQKAKPPTSPQQVSQRITRQDCENQVILCLFFGGPVVLLCGAWFYNEANAHHDRKPPPTPAAATYANTIQTTQPLPTPTPHGRPGVSLTMWYEDLVLERRDLEVKNPAAIRVFNAHVYDYDQALEEARRTPKNQ